MLHIFVRGPRTRVVTLSRRIEKLLITKGRSPCRRREMRFGKANRIHKAKIPICSWGTSCAEKWMSKLALDAQGSHSRSRKRCFKPLVPLHRCQGMRDWKPFNPTRVAPSCTGTNHRVCQLGSSGSARSAPSPLRINLNQKRCIMKRQTIRLQVRNSHSTGQPCPASTCRPLPHVCFRYAENLPLTSQAKAGAHERRPGYRARRGKRFRTGS
jgi:hypothetical protein